MKIWERRIEQFLTSNEKDGLTNQNFDEEWIMTIRILWIFKLVKKYNRKVEEKIKSSTNVGFKG